VVANYIQLKDNDQNKGEFVYTDKRPKETRDIARFIKNTRLATTNKKTNCVFEWHEGNCVFICAIKSIVVGEELSIDYNLN
jgi:hypothetical protein